MVDSCELRGCRNSQALEAITVVDIKEFVIVVLSVDETDFSDIILADRPCVNSLDFIHYLGRVFVVNGGHIRVQVELSAFPDGFLVEEITNFLLSVTKDVVVDARFYGFPAEQIILDHCARDIEEGVEVVNLVDLVENC